MAIREGEATRAIVIAGWIIENPSLGRIPRISHPNPKRSIVDAVRMFIHEYMDIGSPR